MTIAPGVIGIDVSKMTLDVYDAVARRHACIANDPAALAPLVEDWRAAGRFVVMEATGRHDLALRRALATAGVPFARVNPGRARAFARAIGLLAKTDKLDALVLARYAQAIKPPVRRVPTDEAFSELVARRRQLVQMQTQEKNRLKQTTGSLQDGIQRHLSWLKAEIETLNQAIEDGFENSPQAKVLMTIPGVGPVLIATLVADMPELGTLNRQEIASLAGLAPFNRDSGRLKGKRCVWGGRASIRSALYMPTLAAIRLYAPVKAFYQRLRESGKPFKVAITACMRKLLTILNAIAKQHTPQPT